MRLAVIVEARVVELPRGMLLLVLEQGFLFRWNAPGGYAVGCGAEAGEGLEGAVGEGWGVVGFEGGGAVVDGG